MIKTLKLWNFTVFKEAELEFSPGLNVVVGENGTGKSHLLKLVYALLRVEERGRYTEETPESYFLQDFDKAITGLFGQNVSACFRKDTNGVTCLDATWGNIGEVKIYIQEIENRQIEFRSEVHQLDGDVSCLFIPPKEILSIYPGFRAAINSRELAFDDTYRDLADALDAAPLINDTLHEVELIINQLEDLIHAEIVRDIRGNFYFVPQKSDPKIFRTSPKNIHAQMAAEGHRKLGMLSYLIKNGSLKKGSSLFWDEPEANMNPKLLVALARAITELSKIMQITIATHSLFLLRELEILQQEKALEGAKYFGLHFSDDGVTVTQGDDSNSIGDIAALDESINQASRYLCLNEEE